MQDPHDRLIVALDVDNIQRAWEIVDRLDDNVSFYKIGAELIYNKGLELAQTLKKENKKIFIDAQLIGSPRTVYAAAKNIELMGADILTLHGNHSCFQAIEAYRKKRGYSSMKLCCITALTSESEADLRALHQLADDIDLPTYIENIAYQAHQAGADGVVASAREARNIRQKMGSEFLIITPGIRPKNSANIHKSDDQKRVTTPADAIQAGADYLVVGRPITNADDPKLAAQNIIDDIEKAMEGTIASGKQHPAHTIMPPMMPPPITARKKFKIIQPADEKKDLSIPHKMFQQPATRPSQSVPSPVVIKKEENNHPKHDYSPDMIPPRRNHPEKKDENVPQWQEVKPEKRPTNIPTGAGYKSKWQSD
ncbi:MAG: orotidine-5'-phosphate decarboxylase [Alphaproteobacteria bacterium]|nr:orotidine-5'-phosphate decarboxylase [Alphaproteobacteria bacterium]